MAEELKGHVIIIDNYDFLAPLELWLREAFLPSLPENVLVVLASRDPPSASWRSDAGWQRLMRVLTLADLNPNEGRELLTKRGLPTDQYPAILEFTHGHPLALSLVADMYAQREDIIFQPEAASDVVRVLLEQLVQKVPSPAHRTALEASAIVHSTTEGVLAAMLTIPDAYELFQWLRGLSFIASSPLGLFPHDLASDSLIADLRWRNPDWYADLHRRAREYYKSRVSKSDGQKQQQRLIFDAIFLHRDNPLVRPFFAWQGTADVMPGVLRDIDVEPILAMVAKHEGSDSAQLAEYWLRRQPQGVTVFRDAEQQPLGFSMLLALQQISTEDRESDAAVQTAFDYLRRRAPLRTGEAATYIRYWMASDTYQMVSPIQSLITVNTVRHYFTTPNLAFTFLPSAQPDFWEKIFGYADLFRLPDADFEVGGRRYGVFGHDWRVVPPMEWLEALNKRRWAA